MGLFPIERNNLREDIECPGDTIPYNCFVSSNSETVQLTWRITLPGIRPFNLTYDSIYDLNTVDDLGMNITTNLTSYRRDEYIESIIVLTVLRETFINGTLLECLSEDLDSDSNVIIVMQSGTYGYCTKFVMTVFYGLSFL